MILYSQIIAWALIGMLGLGILINFIFVVKDVVVKVWRAYQKVKNFILNYRSEIKAYIDRLKGKVNPS